MFFFFREMGIVFLLDVNNSEWGDALITLDYDIHTKIYITYFIYLNAIFLLLGTTSAANY